MRFNHYALLCSQKYISMQQSILPTTHRPDCRQSSAAFILILALCALCSPSLTADLMAQRSPNGQLTITPRQHTLVVNFRQQPVLEVETAINVTALSHAEATHIVTDYEMVAGKRRHCTNEANEYRCGPMVLRLYNDGIAFRFITHEADTATSSTTIYRITEGTRRWMQQWAESYEGFFPLATTAKVPPVASFSGVFTSPEGYCNRWGYPALLEPADGVFALITEADIEHGQSASCLYNDGERFRVVADKCDSIGATADGCAYTPWRVVIVGTLADVVQSTLVTDVAAPSRLDDTAWIHPGVVSWVYWAHNHGSSNYDIICTYVDLAAKLGLPYVLIDAEWDEMHGGKTIEDALAYARRAGVRPMIWYNSSVGWVDGAPGPKFRLNKAEDREREFAWCEQHGVAGVKIDFFSGDTQANMDYCLELLECAARHHLLVNFHGATIPRGWQRTWPNLLSTEGVYGAEWYNNVATFTHAAARHNATLPFTRNVIGPMDYTPCAFSDSQHPHITTHAHELALTVLFESGLQHLADRPESFLAQPSAVQNFLSNLPAAWDETHLISGYPGESAVIARRSGKTWYVGGINGTDQPKTLNIEALKKYISGKVNITAFKDADQDRAWTIDYPTALPTSVPCRARGGFVLVIKK